MSEAAAIEGQAKIDQSQMNRIADYIVDDDGRAAHAQTLVRKLDQLVRFEMMSKKAATHQIKTSVGEGKGDGIAGYRGCSISGAVSEMRMSSIEERDCQANP